MKLNTLMMSAALSALIAGGAVAQTATTDPAAPDAPVAGTADANTVDTVGVAPEFTAISEMTVGDLIGENVYQPNGDTIGDIDYVIERDGGALAVVGIGGFLGLGEYTVAIPLDDFAYDASQQMVTLDRSKEALKEQTEFDESDVESLPDETPLADLMASTDAPAAGTMSGDDVGAADSALPDEGTADAVPADGMTDDGMTNEGAADDSTDAVDGAADDAADDSATTMDAPAEGDAATDAPVVDDEKPATD
ncbi:PRC-barrel domain-containing protein [Roseovarius dicentrarchi]|uniref:PRC-barrel domain-containing protein n=1 Tax=Roseovarius dicentrarchi TaxID=2250573 RepID=UPI000DEBE437|nr:PRC-barrel domain-containing protein [Roseovarius dicentrarchi]